MAGPLSGIKVIDLSSVISGPLAAQVLADQGAEVIKVEPTVVGDITRIGGYRKGSVSAMYATANRGKRSLALNLAEQEGVDIFLTLCRDADVVIQNFRPGAVERMGIGPAAVHAVNENIIYANISGFGTSGPYSDWRVYDPIIQAVSGVVSIQRSPEIPLPDLIRTIVGDKSTSLTTAQAITAALFARERGEKGQVLDIPMLDTLLYFLWSDTFMAHTFTGDVTPGALLYDIYRLQQTADGHLVYFAVSDSEWEGLCTALGKPEWWAEPRFHDITQRQVPEVFQEIGGLLHNQFLTFATDEIMQRLHDHEVPAAPVNSLDDVFDDPQVIHNDAIHTWEHPTVGEARMARPPVRFSTTQHEDVWAADHLGESGPAILAEYGMDADTISRLIADGIIVVPTDELA